MHEKLDNPVWYSLTEAHKNFEITQHEDVKFYHPDYCPFGGFINIKETAKCIEAYSELTNNFFIVGNKPYFGNSVILHKELVCNQMILESKVNIELEEGITEVQISHKEELFELVNKVQPGYFKKNTSHLGRYFGIFKNHELVAVTGERMKMNAYTEVSAVVTHPEHTGKGYAKQLVALTSNRIFDENKTPYLHVAETNTGAIKLYEKLGFVTRRKISFWNFIRNYNELK